jgi:hypothetical protein
MLDFINNYWGFVPCLTLCFVAVLSRREKAGEPDGEKTTA